MVCLVRMLDNVSRLLGCIRLVSCGVREISGLVRILVISMLVCCCGRFVGR